MPSDCAILINSLSVGTVLTLSTASFNGTNLISGGMKDTITPFCPDLSTWTDPANYKRICFRSNQFLKPRCNSAGHLACRNRFRG
jgi:hypothetical protein